MEIRVAGPEDHQRLEEMTRHEGWNYGPDDFIDLERSGCATTLVASMGDTVMGMITLMDYGDVGWISNMLVERGYRRRRFGGELLREGVSRLGGKRTVALFSYEDALRFYFREGFKLDRAYDVVRYVGGQHGSSGGDPGMDAIASMDSQAFSMKRRPLLEVLAARGEILSPASGSGFALVRPDPVEPAVGPVVCDDPRGGRLLLYAAFNLLGAGAMAVMVGGSLEGVEVVDRVSRMYLGEPPLTDNGLAFAFAGLEYG